MLCLVTTGMSCLGQEGMSKFPLRQKGKYHKFDSVVDSLSCPEIFVVQRDAQIHVAYVITYSPA